ncbi:hypothetical protein [Rathayibacter sp. Leaf296]|uniref:hypothetical protein n=1 Tax=Rathayibacter sp. Leaf296 TaxID=1736327 RepID=UPI000702B329|nr:hypothetical protein [Rathayibacter sp. Leaf296]KQQ07558.1 hypothetical protein ASF46_18135 [Rathayibacter sp. Leaf296]
MSETVPPAALLYQRILESAPERDPAEALRLGADQWPAMQARVTNRYDAETCRVLALSAGVTAQYGLAAVWRARALIRFSELGWMDGVAMIVIGEALATLSRENDDFARGRTLDLLQTSTAPEEILATIEPWARADRAAESDSERLSAWSPGPDLTARGYWEKLGFFALIAHRWDDARERYAHAAAVSRPGRGAGKVRGARVMVEYLAARAGEPHRGDPESVLAEQEGVLADLRAVGDPVLRDAAAHNLEVMRRGGADLLAYEIL